MKNPKIDVVKMTILIEVNMLENGKKQRYHLLLTVTPDPKKPLMKGTMEGYPEIVIEMPTNREDDVQDFTAPDNMVPDSKKKILKAIKELLDRMYA